MEKNLFKGKLNKLPKWLRIILWFLLILFLLIVILWVFLYIYIKTNKKEFILKVSNEISQQIDGHLTIEDMEPALWKSFPYLSVRFKGIKLNDSLYDQHKISLFNFKDAYVKVKTFSLLSQNPQIIKVTIMNGSIHMFKDKNGYVNTYLLGKKKNNTKKPKKGKGLDINLFAIENVVFTFDQMQRNKQFKVLINHIDGNVQTINDTLYVNTHTNVYFYQLGFNLDKGGFVKNKTLAADLKVKVDLKNSRLIIPEQILQVEKEKIQFQAVFNFDKSVSAYEIEIKAEDLNFREGTSMLSRHLAQKFDSVDFQNPICINALLKGSLIPPDTPLVQIFYNVKDNVGITPIGNLNKLNLSGRFVNEYKENQGRGDDNSIIYLDHLTAEWEKLPFRADSSHILDLKMPKLFCQIKSSFSVDKLNSITGSSFAFKGGATEVNLKYNGPLIQTDTHGRSMYGHIIIRDAALSYLPRNLHFKKCNATLEFVGQDLLLKNVSLSSNKSNVHLDGIARQFLSAYFIDPEHAIFDCRIKSDLIDLNEFRSFLVPRKKIVTKTSSKNKNSKVENINNQLDNLIDYSSVMLKVAVNKIIYRKFDANNFKADINLLQSGLSINNIDVQHAGGSLSVKGQLHQNKQGNPFEVKAKINNVQVDKLFYAFENFGLEAITNENLKGNFSGDVNITGKMEGNGDILKNSISGRVSFTLKNGALLNFSPLESIQKFAFKKRNLSNVTFETLSNQLDLNNGKITIHPMTIESSAIVLNVQGVYGIDKGTDISIEAPLRNPQKDKERAAKGLSPKKGRGIVVHLRAKDNNDGKVRLGWDPLKKGPGNEESNGQVIEDFEDEED